MSLSHALLWLVLAAAFGFISYWYKRENRQLHNQWRHEIDDISARSLSRFAHKRMLQTLTAVGICVVAIIAYDWQLRSANKAYEELMVFETMQAEKISQLTAENQEIIAREEALKATIANGAQAGGGYYPSATTPTAIAKGGIVELYNPEGNLIGDQSAMDRIKKRYEDMLVNYMFLKKCGQASETDYHVITSALSQEMASVNAPGRLQYDIVTAATGSFKEMYAKSDCKTPESAALFKDYKTYIATISKQYNAPNLP